MKKGTSTGTKATLDEIHSKIGTDLEHGGFGEDDHEDLSEEREEDTEEYNQKVIRAYESEVSSPPAPYHPYPSDKRKRKQYLNGDEEQGQINSPSSVIPSVENQHLKSRNPFRRRRLDVNKGDMEIEGTLKGLHSRMGIGLMHNESDGGEGQIFDKEYFQNMTRDYEEFSSSHLSNPSHKQKQKRKNRFNEGQSQINRMKSLTSSIDNQFLLARNPFRKQHMRNDMGIKTTLDGLRSRMGLGIVCSEADGDENEGFDEEDKSYIQDMIRVYKSEIPSPSDPQLPKPSSLEQKQRSYQNEEQNLSHSKQLKPISTFKPPILPPELRNDLAGGSDSARDSEAATFKFKGRLSAIVVGDVDNDEEGTMTATEMRSTSTSKLKRKRAMVDPNAASSGRRKANKPSPSVQKKRSFDWKAWSRG